jgi:hypothetical protein
MATLTPDLNAIARQLQTTTAQLQALSGLTVQLAQ